MAKTRAERKARNAQRRADRQSALDRHAAAVTAALDAFYGRLDADAATDACLTVCEECGLEQVSPKPRLEWMDECHPLAYGCVICGNVTGRYAGPLPPLTRSGLPPELSSSANGSSRAS